MPVSEREIFSRSGPSHLTAVDWNNFDHRKAVAASLVKGVSVLERDRQKNREGHLALAPPWWEFFNFELLRPLVDEHDNSIFGAIYEFKSFTVNYNHDAQNAPKYVIATRGTKIKWATWLQDIWVNLSCLCGRLHKRSRFHHAMQAVSDIVAVAGTSSIWLAGHSQGSAILLLVGKEMAMRGDILETYLFNPPFFSVPVEIIENEKLRHAIRFINSMAKAGLNFAEKGCNWRPQEDDPFILLSAWKPHLFVNPADLICCEYIGYFEHRKMMEKIGAGEIEYIATRNSLRSLLLGSHKSEPLHLLPSANLTVNLTHSPDLKRAHGIEQWWVPNFDGRSELHKYRC